MPVINKEYVAGTEDFQMPHCDECDQDLPEIRFRRTPDKKHFYRMCNKCRYNKVVERKESEAGYAETELRWAITTRLRRSQKQKERRASGLFVADYILIDSKQSDRKHNRDNDLDRDFIQNTIAIGCSYCGTKNLRMTLDRVNNDLGHVQTNVVAACIRCNYMRRNIPYDAWLKIVPGIIDAVNEGLFDGWDTYGTFCFGAGKRT